jgi:hypothetical protein
MTTEYATNQNGKPTPEYGAHSNAMRRCTCPDDPNFKHYGGRGIKFLFTSFRQFLADIGRRPEGRLPSGRALYNIHRIDNDGHYEQGNLKWATQKEQCAPGAKRKPTISNMSNRNRLARNETGFKGVQRSGEKYRAQITAPNGATK